MDRRQIGHVLRMLGPLIQLLCVYSLTKLGRDGRFLGLPSRTILEIGVGVGFALVLAGLWLSRRPRSKRRDDALDRPLEL